MPDRLPPHYLDLIANALLHSFWRKRALRTFLRRTGIKDTFLATWHEDAESKREFIYRMFPHLEATEAGRSALRRMARELADQVAFPDLVGWEDSRAKQALAADSVRALKAYLSRQREHAATEAEQAATRKRALELRQHRAQQGANLDSLRARLDALARTLGTAEAGYAFQDWFYDLALHFEIPTRRPYVVDGRQIDGSLTLEGTTYLLELKFTAGQADATDIDTFLTKVNDKADNTMGIMVSISGYSSVALAQSSRPRTPLLLLDSNHIYAVLGGSLSLVDLINRVRRHASQTTRSYLAVSEM